MYTSGWPKTQKRCCQRSGSPPRVGIEEVGAIEAVEHQQRERDREAGKARTIRTEVISVIQMNIGIRISVMPGARMLMIVTKKLNAAAIDATPRICRPRIQKSTLWPGE